MSADLLREAAVKMRERAEAATPGPWVAYGDHLVWPSDKGPAANDPILAMLGDAHDDSAEHITSWHPAVALAVADWLEAEAEEIPPGATHAWHRGSEVPIGQAPAVRTARAYLGRDS